MRGYPAANRMLNIWGDRFKAFFGISLGSFMGMLVVFGIQDFDVIKFDTYLQKLGYRVEQDGSMNNYITKEYGQEATDLIKELIGKGGKQQ